MPQKQPFRGVLRKRCSEITQQTYRRTPMPLQMPVCCFSKTISKERENANQVLISLIGVAASQQDF